MSATFKWCLHRNKLSILNTQVFCVNEFGAKCWYLNDKLHRKNGPAIEYADGTEEWWLNGNYYDKPDYWKEINK